MRIKAALLVVLFILVCASCTATTISDSGSAACAGPIYGIITDENQKTVAVAPGSDAEKQGLQVGDVLVDATWIKLAPAAYAPCYDTFPGGSPIVPIGMRGTSPTPLDPEHPNGPVSFSDEEGVINFLHLDGILKFRVRRGDQMLEMVITPSTASYSLNAIATKGTPTPLPMNYHYY